VFGCIGQRLLEDPVKAQCSVLRKGLGRVGAVELGCDPFGFREQPAFGSQRDGQPQVVQDRGMKLMGNAAEIFRELVDLRLEPAELI
jgi:hypothetical protein